MGTNNNLYNLCHGDIKHLSDQMNQIERNTTILVGVLFSWLVTHNFSNTILSAVVWFLPFVLSALSAWRVHGLNKIVELREAYLIKLEKSYDENNRMFSYFEANKKGKARKTIIGFSAYGFWILLIAVTLVVPILNIFNQFC